jgi:DNA-binding NtrC family response regulator
MSNTGSKLKVLYAEGNTEVLDSQAVLLQKAGYQVDKADGRKSAMDAIKRETYNLVILGSTLSRNDRHHLPYMVKKAHPETGVMVLHADGGRHPQVDAHIDTGSSNELLLETIRNKFSQAGALAQTAAAGR